VNWEHVEINDNSMTPKFGMPHANMDAAIDKVYPYNIDEAWL
jgi:hypothetical protein